MARGAFPSMTALLGLLAVAGYQNRDQLSQMLGNRGGAGGTGAGGTGSGGGLADMLGGLLGGSQGNAQDRNRDGIPDAAQRASTGGAGGLGGLLNSFGAGAGGAGLGGLLGGGLGELNNHMRQNGHSETVDSWVGTGPNRTVEPHDLEAALGPDVLDDLTEQTGLSRQEVLARLSRELPEAVNQYTPHGRLPSDDDYRA